MTDDSVFRALAAAAEGAEKRGQNPALIHEQISRLAAEGVIDDFGDIACELSAHATEFWGDADDLADELLFEDGFG